MRLYKLMLKYRVLSWVLIRPELSDSCVFSFTNTHQLLDMLVTMHKLTHIEIFTDDEGTFLKATEDTYE